MRSARGCFVSLFSWVASSFSLLGAVLSAFRYTAPLRCTRRSTSERASMVLSISFGVLRKTSGRPVIHRYGLRPDTSTHANPQQRTVERRLPPSGERHE